MTKQDKTPMDAETQGVTAIELPLEPISGLALLRVPFTEKHISKLPKPTKFQTEKLKRDMDNKDFSSGIRCELCGGWHHKDVVHLDYVGHAALTDRLLDADPLWNWEPVAVDEFGAPKLDQNGGMWIRLTVCNQTRLGYGDADGKKGGNAVKELIGDALRNAAMRFGAALDLWHKGDLHAVDGDGPGIPAIEDRPSFNADAAAKRIKGKLTLSETLDDLKDCWTQERDTIAEVKAVSPDLFGEIERIKNERRAAIQQYELLASQSRSSDDLNGGDIPYEGPSA